MYLDLCSNSSINLDDIKFRHINGSVFKARYKLIDNLQDNNRFLNVPIAASVTAHAQVLLMRQMFKVGPDRILYCDTDSIMFLRYRNQEKLTKSGLGNWEDEHKDEDVDKFWALAPKAYLMKLVDKKQEDKVDYYLRCKGVRATEENRKKTSHDKIHRLVEQTFIIDGSEKMDVQANTMTIHPNSTNSSVPYGTLCTRYGVKTIQPVYSKRKLLVNEDITVTKLDDMALVRLVPFGYQGNLGNINSMQALNHLFLDN